MIISIEGIDGTGKTSLGIRLSKSLNCPYLDMDTELIAPREFVDAGGVVRIPEINRGAWEISAYAINLFQLTNQTVVLDRGSLSSWAYEQRRDVNLEYLAQVCESCEDLVIFLLVCELRTSFMRDGRLPEGMDAELGAQADRMQNAALALRHRGVKVYIIDAEEDEESVYAQCIEILNGLEGQNE